MDREGNPKNRKILVGKFHGIFVHLVALKHVHLSPALHLGKFTMRAAANGRKGNNSMDCCKMQLDGNV